MAAKQASRRLVVIGSSAGGIAALTTLVATLPADFAAPIVLAQHPGPTRTSPLGDILAAHSTLPIRTVVDTELLEPGVVFVVPPNRHVEITDSHVRLRSDGEGRPRPSVDLLLSSAARVFGERLIAVILTGTGSDGAAGAREVKELGGTVVIQETATASYPGMPRSLTSATVDVVAELERIGLLLHGLIADAETRSVAAPDQQQLPRTFLEGLRERSGIDFGSYTSPTLMRRLQRRLVATGTNTLEEYVRYLEGHPEEYQRLVSSFSIKVTEFFRDPALFDYLRESVVPRLIEEARLNGNELRLWSAGCATGEEAYSLAILVSDLLGNELERFVVRLFATDVDADAVAFARRGIYPASALSDLALETIERYFRLVDGEYEVKKTMRGLVVFGQHDMAQRAPFPRMDLALCRNVLIDLTTDLQRRALRLFAHSLRDGGYLVLGKSEAATPLAEVFDEEEPRLKVYRRRGGGVLPSPSRDSGPAVSRLSTHARTWADGHGSTADGAEKESHGARTTRERSGSVVRELPVGVVVVDARYDIQTINSAARRLLGIYGAAIGEDFVHLAEQVPAVPLRAAIDAALRPLPDNAADRMEVETAAGEARFLEITCYPHRLRSEDGPADGAMILVTDVTARVQDHRAAEEAAARQTAETGRLARQLHALTDSKRRLLEANQALTAANVELRSANERFLVANEEVQATTEGAETLNEELQATNEELETLNQELSTTNDDLQARSVELQELAVSLETQRRTSEAERTRLSAILVSMADAVLVVDRDGAPIRWNAAYERLFGSPTAELVAEDEHGNRLGPADTPRRRAARGASFSMEFGTTAPDGSRRWFEANERPIAGEGGEHGGVVVLRDITDRSVRRLQDEFLAMASHELRTPLTALQGYLEMLLRLLPDEAEDRRLRRFGSVALEQARRITVLVNDLVDVARLESGKLEIKAEPVDLVPLVTRAVETAEPLAKGQTIRLDAEPGPIRVKGDPGRLEQVVLSLLTNAFKYAPGTEHVDVRLRRAGGRAVLEVRDYGRGISPADQAEIFSRFYQVARHDRPAQSGLGLGLFIARETVTAHNGTIEVESADGQGTTFAVRLPLLT